MELGFVEKGKECLRSSEYWLLWTERDHLWARETNRQAKRWLLFMTYGSK